jgi:hypothetical protein
MELIGFVGAMFGVGGGTAAAGTAAAGTAAAGAGAAAGGSSLLATIVQGGLTAFSAASALAGGVAAKSEAKIEEISAGAAASREKIAAEDEAVRINRAMAEAVGSQAVAYAAAGIDLSSGTPAMAKQEARRRANEDFTTNRSNRNYRVAQWNQRAMAARRRGQAAYATGIASAVGDLGGYAVDVINRG